MKKRYPWPLLIILFIALSAPLLSTALFYFWRPPQQVNVGELLPPAALVADWHYADGGSWTPAAWRGRWVLLSAGGGACDADCRRRLCRIRQLRLTLPGHYYRLERAWLITDDLSPPTSLTVSADCGEAANAELRQRAREVDVLAGVDRLIGTAAALPATAQQEEFLYLLDPAGIWVMRFSPELTLPQIRKDLSRLLKLSKGRKTVRLPSAD